MVLVDVAFEKWLGHEGAALMSGVSALITQLPTPSIMWGYKKSETWKIALTPPWSWTSSFQICEQKMLILYKPQSVVYITAAWTDKDGGLILLKTHGMASLFQQINIFIN